MIKELVATGLAGLGIVGGVAAVKYSDDGSAKVEISEDGQTRTVRLGADQSGPGYSCPAGIDSMLAPIDETSGRIKLTIQDVDAKIDQIDAEYPGQYAPGLVVKRYNALVEREHELTDEFNDSVDRRNAVLEAECDPADESGD